jgi:hypothetical protein
MKYIKLLILTAVVGGFSVLSVDAQTPTPTTSSKPSEWRGGGHERHPNIRHAIRALEKAKEELQKADHDFGGHRADALAECDKAIEQLKLALQYDKK